MKKLTFIIALVATTLSGYSQNNNNVDAPGPIEQSKFSIGFKGGYGHSTIMPFTHATFCPSWDAGIAAVYAPAVHWGVEVDALYSEEGVNYKYRSSGEETYHTKQIYLDYVRIPVKAVYFFRAYDKDFRPKIAVGPSMGFLVNQVGSNGASSFDVGATGLVGFNYRIAKAVWINVDAVYYQGFLDTYSNRSSNELNSNMRLDAGINVGF